MAKDDPCCEHHPATQLLPDTFGYWYCPDCDDEGVARRALGLQSGQAGYFQSVSDRQKISGFLR